MTKGVRTMTQTTDLEFVNDWSELEAAAARLGELAGQDYVDIAHGYDPEEDDDFAAMAAVAKYVPRLLTQYANLVELSFALTEGWETYATLNTPSGLYLPDNS